MLTDDIYMKKSSLYFLVSVFLVCLLVWGVIFYQIKKSSVNLADTRPVMQGSVSYLKPSPEIAIPVKLVIPKLKIDVMVESVGLDDKGRMDVPKGVTNVAWYSLGVKPGQAGNSVIDGHFDQPDGSPSVFFKLNQTK